MPRSLARELVTPGLHVDRTGFYPGTAALNAAPVVAALAFGIAIDEVGTGLLLAIGALFAGIPGLGSPPRKRMTAMVITSVLAGISTFVGVWTGGTDAVAIVVMAAWAFAGAMLGALGRTEGLIGATTVLALLLVAQYPASFDEALLRGLIAFAGAVIQLAVTVIAWRIDRDRPQRAALSDAYAGIAALARAPRREGELVGLFGELRAATTTVQDAEGGAAPRSERGRARRNLLHLADAIVLEVAALRSLGDQGVPVTAPLGATADALDAIATAIQTGHGADDLAAATAQGDAAQAAMTAAPGGDPALRTEALERLGHLRDRLRTAWRATEAATGPHVPGRIVDPAETRRRMHTAAATVRANLTLDSAICRHAIRLAAATATGVALYRIFDIPHGYWVPLTVLFVLRPDFGSTFSRGALRAGGTIAGILVAAGVLEVLGPADTLALIPIAIFAWGTLAFLFANYAVFTASITALVVTMLDLAGEPAVATMDDRLVASAIGIVIALVAFLVWPTWTAQRMSGAIGDYVEALRMYAVGVLHGLTDPATHDPAALEPLRVAQRLARANADDALAATLHEPQHRRGRTGSAAALLGAGYHVHEAAIVLDVHLHDGDLRDPLPGLSPLTAVVDAALVHVEQWWTTGGAVEVHAPAVTPPLPDAEPAVVHEAHVLAAATQAMACAAR